MKWGVKMVTEKQKLKAKKKKLEEKIRTSRLLFNLGVEEPSEENVENWLKYHKNKHKPRIFQKARKNAQKKINLLGSMGLRERAEKIEKVMEEKYTSKYRDFHEMVEHDIVEINQRLEYETTFDRTKYKTIRKEEHCKITLDPLIKYLISCGTEEARDAIFYQCQQEEKAYKKIYGFGMEYETRDAEVLFETVNRIRLGHLIGVETGFDIREERSRKNYYNARSELRKLYREKRLSESEEKQKKVHTRNSYNPMSLYCPGGTALNDSFNDD